MEGLLQFIDLSDIEENDKILIQEWLDVNNNSVKGPWKNIFDNCVNQLCQLNEENTVFDCEDNSKETTKDLICEFKKSELLCKGLEEEMKANMDNPSILQPLEEISTRIASVDPIVEVFVEYKKSIDPRPDKELESFLLESSYYKKMREYLRRYTVNNDPPNLHPRGLINRSNYCYIHSILQALLACPSVHNLLTGLSKINSCSDDKDLTPAINSMCLFFKEYNNFPVTRKGSKQKKKKRSKENNSENGKAPYKPDCIYDMIKGSGLGAEDNQEDAEEFLNFLLNILGSEMVEIFKSKKGKVSNPITTPIHTIFGGQLRSTIYRAGEDPSHNIQDFFTLPLDIENVYTVNGALNAFTRKTKLEGVTSTKSNEKVEAWQQVTIEELPNVLVLHLKCFKYTAAGCIKVIKSLKYKPNISIDPNLLASPSKYSEEDRQYKLFAVVHHDGKKINEGHFFTHAFHTSFSTWLQFDDSLVLPIEEEDVLKPTDNMVPYLLFYSRCNISC